MIVAKILVAILGTGPTSFGRREIAEQAPVGEANGARVVGRINGGDDPAVTGEVFEQRVIGQRLHPAAGHKHDDGITRLAARQRSILAAERTQRRDACHLRVIPGAAHRIRIRSVSRAIALSLRVRRVKQMHHQFALVVGGFGFQLFARGIFPMKAHAPGLVWAGRSGERDVILRCCVANGGQQDCQREDTLRRADQSRNTFHINFLL